MCANDVIMLILYDLVCKEMFEEEMFEEEMCELSKNK